MSGVGKAIGKVVGGITGANAQAKGAEKAAGIQSKSYEKGVAEQRRQFDALVELMAPFVGVGEDANAMQAALAGVGDPELYQQTVAQIEAGPQFQSLVQQGEEALLQNASATGGLRGGNLQGALAQYRPEILSQLINQRFSQLGSLADRGQASAGLQASAGGSTASNIANLYAQQGGALAGGALAKAGAQRMAFGDALNIANTAAKVMGAF